MPASRVTFVVDDDKFVLTLLVGGLLGVQMGAFVVQRVSGEVLRMLLGIIIVCLCLFLISELVIDPKYIFILDLLQ